ncbi:winged helix DNA-binding domain-containing protein [Janibacter hoylei]|uniref:winged helix DNA-binding domain-containing protein n=1 Tax=Janibacter hoylei TaxID=364298 RepID=UPI0021A36A69|nr:crosslink repair DNA glycosylase YcaQ family protein [Janibacter hoylei]MCT1620245.1 winged helix DNA-binding domain-containing protein [Janibacter hoylei]MCT2294139.1 winged helix DNA-binding domain-containing protein [Janibacter hoylei]
MTRLVTDAEEAATVHLAVGARTTGVTPSDVEGALYDDRSIVKQLAMRRTLFAFPRDLLPAALAVARGRIAPEQHRLVSRDAARHGIADDGEAWLATAGAAVERRLAGGEALTAVTLRAELPELTGAITVNEGKRYGGTFNLAPRVLTWLGAEGRITRGPNAGHWRLSKPAWTLTAPWLGEQPSVPDLAAGYAELVRRWLAQYGPGTLDDVQWWLGATKGATRTALEDVGAVEVDLEGGRTGWLLPDDLDPVDEVGPWAALLPTLDPTTMGGSTATGTSTPPTATCSSTATATAARPRGGRGGSSAPGSRTTTGSSRSSSARAPTSPAKGGPPSPPRRHGSPPGSTGCGSPTSARPAS